MTLALLYTLFWGLAIVGMVVGFIVLPIVGLLGCCGLVYYSTRGRRLGVRRNPRRPSALAR